jgi:hypothetical protein
MPLPAETIIHVILPGLASANRLTSGDFSHGGLPYLTRDVLVLSSTLQWLGTNVGRCFLEEDISQKRTRRYHPEREFVIKLDLMEKEKCRDMVSFFTHVCTPQCTKSGSFWSDGCVYKKGDSHTRDRAVVDGLMRWLGQESGRAFLAEYATRKKSAWNAVHESQRKAWAEMRAS